MKTPIAAALLWVALPACHDVAAAERWEYRVVYASELSGVDSIEAGFHALRDALADPLAAGEQQRGVLEQHLNALGDEGWELVGGLDNTSVFKRRGR